MAHAPRRGTVQAPRVQPTAAVLSRDDEPMMYSSELDKYFRDEIADLNLPHPGVLTCDHTGIGYTERHSTPGSTSRVLTDLGRGDGRGKCGVRRWVYLKADLI